MLNLLVRSRIRIGVPICLSEKPAQRVIRSKQSKIPGKRLVRSNVIIVGCVRPRQSLERCVPAHGGEEIGISKIIVGTEEPKNLPLCFLDRVRFRLLGVSFCLNDHLVLAGK